MLQTLDLPISNKWFDMIVSGDKMFEYRDIKKHWISRMIGFKNKMDPDIYYTEFLEALQNPYWNHADVPELLSYFNAFFRRYDLIKFRNGYRWDSPCATFKWEGCDIAKGLAELGASGEYQFVIQIGEMVDHYLWP